MGWEQKFAAMQSLVGHFNCCLMMRKPGDWYVSARGREISSGCALKGKFGNGHDPISAIEADWRECVETLEPHEYIVIHASGDDRRAVRWNGFMWESVQEKLRKDFA